MSDPDWLPALDDLKGSVALAWAADCVEHLSRETGDSPGGDVAACVAWARKYAHERVYDAAAAHALTKSAGRARLRLNLDPTYLFDQLSGVWTRDEMRDALGWRETRRLEPSSRPSNYTLNDGAVKTRLDVLLKAAEALCQADPHEAAREAAKLCRKALASEADWQVDRLQDLIHGQASESPAPSAAPPSEAHQAPPSEAQQAPPPPADPPAAPAADAA